MKNMINTYVLSCTNMKNYYLLYYKTIRPSNIGRHSYIVTLSNIIAPSRCILSVPVFKTSIHKGTAR